MMAYYNNVLISLPIGFFAEGDQDWFVGQLASLRRIAGVLVIFEPCGDYVAQQADFKRIFENQRVGLCLPGKLGDYRWNELRRSLRGHQILLASSSLPVSQIVEGLSVELVIFGIWGVHDSLSFALTGDTRGLMIDLQTKPEGMLLSAISGRLNGKLLSS